MLTLEELLNCEYEQLKYYIVCEYPEVLGLLKDKRLKSRLINSDNKYEFIWLAQEIPDKAALLLLDEIGLEILSDTSNLPDKMNGIMTCGKEYVTELVKKKCFCDIIKKHYNALKHYLSSFSLQAALLFTSYIQDNYPDMLGDVLLKFSFKVQTEIVKELELPIDVAKRLVVSSTGGASEYLMDNDFRIVSINDYTFQELFTIFSKHCQIPMFIATEPKLIYKLSTIDCIKDYRFLINALVKNNDVDLIERTRKKYYDYELKTYNTQVGMLKRHYDFYLEFCELMKEDSLEFEVFDEILYKYFNLFGSGSNEWYLKTKLSNYYAQKDVKGLEEFLIKESNLQISNILIDYHFEDVPYNFFLDVRQLCNFKMEKVGH